VEVDFSAWIVAYFNELTKLLKTNLEVNFKELEKILNYQYPFLALKLSYLAYLANLSN
jgi:hypothetical protein